MILVIYNDNVNVWLEGSYAEQYYIIDKPVVF